MCNFVIFHIMWHLIRVYAICACFLRRLYTCHSLWKVRVCVNGFINTWLKIMCLFIATGNAFLDFNRLRVRLIPLNKFKPSSIFTAEFLLCILFIIYVSCLSLLCCLVRS